MNRRNRILLIIGVVTAVVAAGAVVMVSRSGDDDAKTKLSLKEKASTSTSREATTTTGLGDATTTSVIADVSTTVAASSQEQVGSPAVTAKPRPTRTTRPPAEQASGPCNSGAGTAAANRIADLFCDHRANAGLPVMRRTAALDSVAQAWADHMAQSHETPPPHNPSYGPQVLAACAACSGWAENVAYWETNSPDSIWQAWLNSASHRPNIEYVGAGEYGIGVAYSGDGWVWVVHDFGRY